MVVIIKWVTVDTVALDRVSFDLLYARVHLIAHFVVLVLNTFDTNITV